ncbi:MULTISPECIES: ribokinase [Chromohalobacter]|jgi:ribokinase|uniref:ribokinase n=1 Tax=Chromohalobacter TaxID=42054 RepID=UPI000D7097D4|nr:MULTISPECIES: ribokinase [Chromohalobacter]NQY46838.1 ribokinase [Chromohalobacter sp.]NWO56595.1 ribokinase [Chromohalobacter salexigens]PWW40715.1 ribokinase [Chromohalobacter salexigens]
MLYNYGSINIDHVYRVSHLVRPGETLSSQSYTQVLGGKGANQSLAMARAGGEVTHWGRLSQGDRWALETLARAGVNTSLIELTADASGHAIIQVDDHAENAIILNPGANHGFSERHIEALMTSVQPGDWLLLQNECNALGTVMTLAARHGMRIAFNPAPLGANVHSLPLELCQVLFLNRGEAAALAGLEDNAEVDALLDVLSRRLPDVELVLTLGRDGVCYQWGEQRLALPALPVEAVDTTAAGDTFIGYFMAARQREASIDTCLREASAAAALCVQRAGAAPSIPLASDVAASFHE